jgi:hypothetical protein
MREFIRRTVELVEKRRDEYGTNDEFSKNLTSIYQKLLNQSFSDLVQFNSNVNSHILQNFSFLRATEKQLWEEVL